MLKKIHLKNFQAFGGETAIPLAPLTLIFGPNSSGKSAIMKSLLFVKQSLGEAGGTPAFISSDVDLGSFTNTVYKHDDNLEITIGFEFDQSNDSINFSIDSSGKFSKLTVSGDAIDGVSESSKSSSPLPYQVSLTRTENNIYLFDKLSGRSLRHLALASLLNTRALHQVTSKPLKLNKDFSTDVTVSASNTDPEVSSLATDIPTMSFRFSNSRISRIRDLDGKKNKFEQSIYETFAIERILNRPLERARSFLANVYHLGGLRAVPDRYEILGNTSSSLGSDASNLASFLSNRSRLVREISKWLTQFTDGAYGLELVKLQRDERIHTDLNALILVDKRSKITTSFRDVGLGLSQVLPIITRLVQLSQTTRNLKGQLTSHRKVSNRSGRPLLLVEQPELHLHPRMQLQLAELFAKASAAGNEDGPQLVVETHSESLILRIQKLIREGQLKSDSVSVLYVDRDKRTGKSRVNSLPLAENGEFLAAWPEEFADLRLEEFF